MPPTHSKLTAQGQVSVPAEVRRKLGIGPGSVLQWSVEDNQVIVRRAGRFSSEEIHEALFGGRRDKRRRLSEYKDGIKRSVRDRHARR